MALLALPVRAMVEAGGGPAVAAAAGNDDSIPTDARHLSASLLAQMRFEDLGLQLIGVASFGGQTSCFIRQPGTMTPQALSEGDPISDFRVVSIATDSVIFERGEARFVLALGGESEEPAEDAVIAGVPADLFSQTEPDPLDGVQQEINELLFTDLKQVDADDASNDEPASFEAVMSIKSATGSLKSRTGRFETAQVVQDAWTGSKIGKRPGAPNFILPIKGRMTSSFGYRRHPMGGGQRMHNGIDLAAPYGTTVRAAADGTVSRVGYNGALGRYVYVRHANGYETRYGHLSARLVKTGQQVAQGDAIGREGSTGNSTGPHLHFEIRKNGRALNPTYYLDN